MQRRARDYSHAENSGSELIVGELAATVCARSSGRSWQCPSSFNKILLSSQAGCSATLAIHALWGSRSRRPFPCSLVSTPITARIRDDRSRDIENYKFDRAHQCDNCNEREPLPELTAPSSRIH